MTPTVTAPDPAVFPEDVRRFAAERSVTQYLVPLYELAKRCFDGIHITLKVEHDYEIPGLSWIVYEVPIAQWDNERYRAAKAQWYSGFCESCPSDDYINFVLGLR